MIPLPAPHLFKTGLKPRRLRRSTGEFFLGISSRELSETLECQWVRPEPDFRLMVDQDDERQLRKQQII